MCVRSFLLLVLNANANIRTVHILLVAEICIADEYPAIAVSQLHVRTITTVIRWSGESRSCPTYVVLPRDHPCWCRHCHLEKPSEP